MEDSATRGPKWLRKLVRESWQAELIVSGAAILGTLQLPALLEWFQYYVLVNYDRPVLLLWFLATTYWAIFVYGLIVLFIYHFILRALWIGLLGLKSKYPNGIARTTLTSEDFQNKAIAEYGDLDGYILRLDKSASGLFGTGFATAGIFLNIGLILSVAIVIVSYLQSWGVSTTLSYVIVLLPLVLIVLGSMASALLALPRFRNRAWVKRNHFGIVKTMNRLANPVNHLYIMMGINLSSSNAFAEKYKDKKVGAAEIAISLLGILLISGLAGVLVGVTDVIRPQFIDNYYWRMGNDATIIDQANYADSDYAGILYEPRVNALHVNQGEVFDVWVPLPEREYRTMTNECSVAAVDTDTLSREEARTAKYVRTQTCATEYIELYLDEAETPLPLPTPLRHYLTTQGVDQFGVYLDLTDQLPPPGRHTLRVVTRYELDPGEDERHRTTFIPFFVVGG